MMLTSAGGGGKELLTRNPSIVSRKIADEYILVPTSRSAGDLKSVFTLNEVGAHIWGLIDGTRCRGDIRDSLVEHYDVAPETAEADLEEFLQRMKAAGALRGD